MDEPRLPGEDLIRAGIDVPEPLGLRKLVSYERALESLL